MNLNIYPSVGVARLGNSHGQFYLAPTTIGGLPYEADPYGNPTAYVQNFKDPAGQVRRQGQPFKIYQDDGTEITLDSPNVDSITWTVHIANKKAAWYQYSELEGNLLYGSDNSYENRKVPFRNPSQTSFEDRQQLIIDPGPRSISGKRQAPVSFDKANAPADYPVSFPPDDVKYGVPITSLGDLLTDNQGRLIVLGGFGHAGGSEPLTSYGGSDTWHDDISDGPVYCQISFNDGRPDVTLQAWVIIGSPDFAPEIVNISTLSDTMFDVGVRYFDLMPDLYAGDGYNPDFIANYERDILPIVSRLADYQWVSNIQPMLAFASNNFDLSDPSPANQANREMYYSYFRPPNDKSNSSPDQPQAHLFKEDGNNRFPMLPLNSGSNSVSNETTVKFLSLNDTQQFLLGQWAKGAFVNDPNYKPYPVHPINAGSVGNCVGLPMCPGIEVTWSLQNPALYSAPYRIADARGIGGYNDSGLTPSRDECEGGGCEPGDLTKRMACPWQADFFQCTIQYVNFTNPAVNKVNGVPLVPTYYSYWWPPQSPWDVLTGEFTKEGQEKSHLPSGLQVNYARGINSFRQMVEHWSALAFIRNQNSGNAGFPFFTETERTNELFSFKEVPVSQITGNSDDEETTIPVFYIESDAQKISLKSERGKLLANALETRAFKAISVHHKGLGLPRSGTRSRH